MKNKSKFLAVSALLTSALFALPACGETAHTHTFSEVWSKNETSHWHEATCGDTDDVSGLQPHLFEDGVCYICGYKDPSYQSPASGDQDKDEDDEKDPGDEDSGESGDEDSGDGEDHGGNDQESGSGQGSSGGQGSGGEDSGNSGEGGEENQDEDELFGGTYTDVILTSERNQVKDFIIKATRKIGAGSGFSKGDLFYQLSGDSMLSNTYVSGLQGDLSSGEHLKVKQVLRSPNDGGQGPICEYAVDDQAYEEYENEIHSYDSQNAGKIAAKNVIDNIWYTFSIAPSMFENNCAVSYKKDGTKSAIRLSLVQESEVGYGQVVLLKDEITVEFALSNGKLTGLRFVSDSEYEGSTQVILPDSHTAITVLVGDYSNQFPDLSKAIKQTGSPNWIASTVLPEEEFFENEMSEINDQINMNYFGWFVSTTRSRLAGGMEAVLINANFSVKQKIGEETTETVYDLYNGEGVKVKQTKGDETKYSKEDDAEKILGELSELFDSDLIYLLKTYVSEYYQDEHSYALSSYRDENFFMFKMTDTATNHETTYVYSMNLGSLLAIKDVKTLDDGTEQETILLCGDYQVDIPQEA